MYGVVFLCVVVDVTVYKDGSLKGSISKSVADVIKRNLFFALLLPLGFIDE